MDYEYTAWLKANEERKYHETDRSTAYEVHNPDFNDMNLQQQIEAGCCDWCVEGTSGHRYYGQSPRAAEQNAAMYFYR